ncbi:hypothetical protein QBC39DRAFT_260685 [Podospora conica]|nr:hypothetical protein QBC39DRAFT_260685 [Schizothecium conicum]
MSAPQAFDAGNLPQGAFLTTLGGRRCTAVPRPAPTTSAEPPAVASVAPPAPAAPPAAATTSIGAIPAASRETSPTDSSVTAPAASDIAANDPPAPFPDQDQAAPSPSQDPAFPDVIAAPTNGVAAPEATGTSPTSNSAVSMLPSSSGSSVQSTVAVAGGVIGGVVALSIAAFLIWWWRRRVIKKRRSTLLTPLDAATYRDDKGGGPYEINRGSIGPTPMGEKLRAAVGYNVKRIRGRLLSRSGPSVNMDRGTSQFIEVNNHSRATSSATAAGDGVTAKDRLTDWWSRTRYNWKRENRLSRDTLSIGGGNLNSSSIRSEKPPPLSSSAQPDFLTLLNMDSDDRDAARRRASLSRQNGSGNQFLGKLDLSFGGGNGSDDNPFSDAHASAKPAPLVVSATNNPFSDANAIRDANKATPATYVADMRRSRGQSVSQQQQQGYASQQQQGTTRGSVDSSFADRRNKFRSDPFDLEPRRSFVSSTAGTMGSGGSGESEVRRPPGAHRRGESFTSKYSSGISMGDWSDPGPDVGPAASREMLPLPEELEKAKGRGSGGSVGKAM